MILCSEVVTNFAVKHYVIVTTRCSQFIAYGYACVVAEAMITGVIEGAALNTRENTKYIAAQPCKLWDRVIG